MSEEYFLKGDSVTIENGLITKTKTGWGNGLVLLDPGVASGVHRWTFRAIEGKKATIGICDATVDLNTYVNQTTKGWGYYQANGKKGTNGPAKIEFGEPYRTPGDVVVMEFDADKGQLQFWRNNKFVGVAFDNIPVDGKRKFCAAVSLFKVGAALRILQRPFDGKGAAARGPGAAAVAKSPKAKSPKNLSPNSSGSRSHAKAIKPLRFNAATVELAPSSELPGHMLARKRVKGWDDGLIVFEPIFDPTKHTSRVWSFKVLKGLKITIGIVLHDTAVGYVNKTQAGWGYYMANGRIGHNGPAKRSYGPSYQAGDVVTVELAAHARTNVSLRFYLNAVALGEAYSIVGLGRKFAAAVSLYAAEDSIIALTTSPTFNKRDLPPLPVRHVSAKPALRAKSRAAGAW